MKFLITRKDYLRVVAEERELAARVGRRLTVGRLREALVQRGYAPLVVEGGEKTEEGGESLDNQVDEYLNQYVKASQEAIKSEGSGRPSAFRRFLMEADDEEEGSDDGGDEGKETPEAPAGVDELDVEKFTDQVVNLVENYQNLLEVKDVVIKRAVRLLKERFDEGTAKSFVQILRDGHSLGPGVSKSDVEDEEFVAPYAAEAGPLA